MGKFKINDKVIVKSTGEKGVVMAREVIPIEGSKQVRVEYIVRTGNGFKHWKVYNKDEIETIQKSKPNNGEYIKVFDVVDGYKITIYTKVTNDWGPFGKMKDLRLGYSIYNPSDKYDEKIGIKIARDRAKKSPFCSMRSGFSGEFNEMTVKGIMDAKADYIKNNFDKFINKRFSHKAV